MKNKRILITGGCGFIGSHLSRKLCENNKVVVIDNLLHGNKLKKKFKNIKVIEGDICDLDLLYKSTKNIDVIFHLAAYLGVDFVSKNNVKTMDVEFEGTQNVCKAAITNNIKKIIYTSTSGVYGKLNYQKDVKEDDVIAPYSAYAMAKRNSEIYLKYFSKENKINSIIVRLFNVYGEGQDSRMVIPRFYEQAINNKDITIYGDGKQTRDFTYIDDCIKSIINTSDLKTKGCEIFNISKGKQENIKDLAKIIKSLVNSKSKIKHIDTPRNLLDFQVKKRCGNSNYLKQKTGYKPKTLLKAGLERTYNL